MKLFYYCIAIATIVFGFIELLKVNDIESFRFCVLCGILFNICAKVEDL